MAVKKKAKSPDVALKRMLDHEVTNKTQAKRALKKMMELQEQIAELEARHGLAEMRNEAVALKKSVQNFMVEYGVDDLQLGDGVYAKVIRQAFDRHWVLYAQDLESVPPEGFRSLRSILRSKFRLTPEEFKRAWNKVTKRVPDPDGIQELVRSGEITEEELAPAYVERERAPYLRIFGGFE